MLSSNDVKIDYAILSALPEEQNYYHTLFANVPCKHIVLHAFTFSIFEYKNKQILLAATGFGTTFATAMVTFIHTIFSPDVMLFTGTAGGIDPKLHINDVVIAEQAFEAEIQSVFTAVKGTPFETCLVHPINKQNISAIHSANDELCAMAREVVEGNVNVHSGTVVTSNQFPAPLQLFNKMKSLNPLAIDMETSALYQTAWLLGIRLLAIRGISNKLNAYGEDPDIHLSDVAGSAAAAAKVALQVIEK